MTEQGAGAARRRLRGGYSGVCHQPCAGLLAALCRCRGLGRCGGPSAEGSTVALTPPRGPALAEAARDYPQLPSPLTRGWC
jgi:hypothetical protein